MSAPSVLAVVVNWNGRELLEPCLGTLLESSYPNLGIMVVDNASEDGSPAFVREHFGSVRLLASDENLGYAGGANLGLREAAREGVDYVFLLNNDTEVAEDAVAELVRAAQAHPRAALLGPMIYYHDRPDVIWSAGGRVTYWTGDIRHLGIRTEDTGQYVEATEVDYVTGCAVLVSMAAAREVGFMSTEYFMYNEDTDWCIRAKRAGYSVIFVPRARVWHKVSMSSGGGLTPFKIYHRLLSTFRFFRKYARPYHWLGIVPATLARACVFVVRELLSGRAGNVAAVARGLCDAASEKRRT